MKIAAPHPPRIARWLLKAALPRRDRQPWLGDLDEEYRQFVVGERGRRGARGWYWRQVLRSMMPALSRRRHRPIPTRTRRSGALEVTSLMDSLLHDLRYSVRSLLARPTYALVALATLVLGLGVNAAIFSVVYGSILRPLPYADPDRLVRFWPDALFSYGVGDILALQQNADRFEVAAYGRALVTFTGDGDPEMIRGAAVSPNHFDLLGVRPMFGRTFAPGEGAPGNDRLVVLSHGLWALRFGGDPSIVGQSTEIQGEPWQVIGVMKPEHQPLEYDWKYWRPLDMDAQRNADAPLAAVGRLRPGVTFAEAGDQMREVLVDRWASQGVQVDDDTRARMIAGSLRVWILGDWRPRLLLLLGAVALVLLIACANVANLMLARTSGRQRELGLRAAIGATRGSLVRLVLVEALLLASAGAFVGLLAANAVLRIAASALPTDLPRVQAVGLDAVTLGYTALMAVFAAAAFGAVPALRAIASSRLSIGAGRTGVDAAQTRLNHTFVAVQIALSVVLVVGAGLLLRSFWKLQSVNPGFRSEGLVTLRPAPPSSLYPQPADVQAYHADVREALLSIPGVRSVGGIMFLPMQSGAWQSSFRVPEAASEQPSPTSARSVTVGYIETMEIPVLAGRAFDASDGVDGEPVVIVNETLARAAWTDGEAVGREILFEDASHRVVGVIADVRQRNLATVALPETYVPSAQVPWRNMYFAVRVDGPVADFVPRIRDAVRALDAGVPINNLMSMDDVVAETTRANRFLAGFVVAFGAVALALGMVGVYGVTAYVVAQQRRDIGIRMAVGAGTAQVLAQTMLRGARPVLIGVVVGLAAAAAAGNLARGALYEVSPFDGATFVVVAALLFASAALALWLPARRATRVDPARVLQTE